MDEGSKLRDRTELPKCTCLINAVIVNISSRSHHLFLVQEKFSSFLLMLLLQGSQRVSDEKVAQGCKADK